MELKNVKLALVAASLALVAPSDAAAKALYPDASGTQAQALQLALAYLPVEFLLFKSGYSALGTQPVYYCLYGTAADVSGKTYQPVWGSAPITAKAIAQTRQANETDALTKAKWDTIIAALAV